MANPTGINQYTKAGGAAKVGLRSPKGVNVAKRTAAITKRRENKGEFGKSLDRNVRREVAKKIGVKLPPGAGSGRMTTRGISYRR